MSRRQRFLVVLVLICRRLTLLCKPAMVLSLLFSLSEDEVCSKDEDKGSKWNPNA